uniref:Plasminogen receptor (KT) n=1 Tax=Rhabditophanes sp. KR3021 TaxID=114890 RepID=A0AC35TTK9_9BILA
MFEWFFGKANYEQFSESQVKRIIAEIEDKRIERELAIKEIYEEKERAFKIAEAREQFFWTCPTGILISCLSAFSTLHHKNVLHLLPIGPAIAFIAYQSHFAFGNKTELIMTRLLMDSSSNIVTLKPLTVEDVEERKKCSKQNSSESF